MEKSTFEGYKFYSNLNLISQIIILGLIIRSFVLAYVLIQKTDYVFLLSFYLITEIFTLIGLVKYIQNRIKEPKYKFTNVNFEFNWIEYTFGKHNYSKHKFGQLGPFTAFSYLIIFAVSSIFSPTYIDQTTIGQTTNDAFLNLTIFWFLITHANANLYFKKQFPFGYLRTINNSYSDFNGNNLFNELHLEIDSELLIDRKISEGEMCKITIPDPKKGEVRISSSSEDLLITSIESDSLIHLITKETYYKFNSQIIRYSNQWGVVKIRIWIVDNDPRLVKKSPPSPRVS